MSETAYVSDIFQLIDMKVLITEDSLDSLLSIKISQDGGKTYTDHSVSSLKNGGITLDCSPNNLKVICDANVLKYIQVLADGEKSTSNVDLSDYLKYRDIYIDVYKNPYYGVTLTDEEADKLYDVNQHLYAHRDDELYFSSENFKIYTLNVMNLVDSTNWAITGNYLFNNVYGNICIPPIDICDRMDNTFYVYNEVDKTYFGREVYKTDVRVHFIKHF